MAQSVNAYLEWWELAGVDGAVGEAPVGWLRPSSPLQREVATAQKCAAADVKPETLEAFVTWLMEDLAQPERRWPGRAVAPQGSADATLMVVTDMPDAPDMTAGALLADRAGQLFDAMLAVIGLTRANIYLTSLFASRPPGGMVEAADIARAADRVRTEVALARPQRLLLLGDRTARAFQAAPGGGGLDILPFFNHDGGTVPVFATFHPRLLLGQPAAKAECWRVLQRLTREQQK